jgi:hypothetical protein
VVKAFNATYPAIWYKIIKNNKSCWQNAAEVWAQVRTLQNNMIVLKIHFIIQEMTYDNQHNVRSRHQNVNGSVFVGYKSNWLHFIGMGSNFAKFHTITQ